MLGCLQGVGRHVCPGEGEAVGRGLAVATFKNMRQQINTGK